MNHRVFDSSGRNSSELADMASVIGESVTVEMTRDGEVLDVTGADRILAKIFDSRYIDGSVRQMLESQFGDEAIKMEMERTFEAYPDTPVTVGSKWTSSSRVSFGIDIDCEEEYTLLKADRNGTEISVKGKIGTRGAQDIFGTRVHADLQGTQSGTIKLEAGTNMLKHLSMEQRIQGTISAEGQSSQITIRTNIKMAAE